MRKIEINVTWDSGGGEKDENQEDRSGLSPFPLLHPIGKPIVLSHFGCENLTSYALFVQLLQTPAQHPHKGAAS